MMSMIKFKYVIVYDKWKYAMMSSIYYDLCNKLIDITDSKYHTKI